MFRSTFYLILNKEQKMKSQKHFFPLGIHSYTFTSTESPVSPVTTSWRFSAQKSAVATQQRSPLFLKKEISDSTSSQRSPLFLKEKGGAGERENFFSREKKFSLVPRTRIYLDRIAGGDCYYSDIGGDIAACAQFSQSAGAECQLSEQPEKHYFGNDDVQQ